MLALSSFIKYFFRAKLNSILFLINFILSSGKSAQSWGKVVKGCLEVNTFFAPKWLLAVARDHLRGKKSLGPSKSLDFHGPPLVMAFVMDFPPRKWLSPAHYKAAVGRLTVNIELHVLRKYRSKQIFIWSSIIGTVGPVPFKIAKHCASNLIKVQ